MHVLPLLRKMPEWVMQKMSDSVLLHGVRCITGTFGLDGVAMGRFASNLPMATVRPVCQTWRGDDGQTYVFPCYTMLIGNSSNRTKTAELLNTAVAVSNKWVPTIYPFEDVMPQWRQMSRDQVELSPAFDIDWGHVKEKAVSPDRWIPHVHQVLWWAGSSQQGAHARIRSQAGRMAVRSCGPPASSERSPKKNALADAQPEEERSCGPAASSKDMKAEQS